MSAVVLAGILGALAVLAGVIAFRYAGMASDDFNNPNVPFWTAILGAGLMWLLTLGAFCMGIHFLMYSFTANFFRLNRWVRALILGTLSFFPGFIVSAVPATILVLKRWPTDVRADNIAMLTSVFVGSTLAIVVCVALIKGTRNEPPQRITVDRGRDTTVRPESCWNDCLNEESNALSDRAYHRT